MYYNLKTNSFTKDLPSVIETDFLRITTCEHTTKQVVTLITFGDEPLCLHNEDDSEDKTAVELFINEDENFKKHLDFFNQIN
jgi:hypothetical protein